MLWVLMASAVGWAIGLGLLALGMGLLIGLVLVPFLVLGFIFKLVMKVLFLPLKLLAWVLGALFMLILILGTLFLVWVGLCGLSVGLFG